MITFGFAGRGAFYVENYYGALIDFCRRDVTAGLDQHLVAAFAKLCDKRKCVFLGKRFAAGDLDEVAAEIVEFCENIVKRNVLAACKSVFAVAPDATHRAARQTHKRTRSPGM